MAKGIMLLELGPVKFSRIFRFFESMEKSWLLEPVEDGDGSIH